MAITVYEKPDSRKLTVSATAPKIERKYTVQNEGESELDLIAAVVATAPILYLGLVRDAIDLDPDGTPTLRTASVTYVLTSKDGGGKPTGEPLDGVGQEASPPSQPEPPGDDDPLGSEYGFDTTGQTIHVTQSVDTRHKVALDGAGALVVAPDLGGAIGVSKDRVEGTDIYAGKLEWTVTMKFAFLTRKYIRTLRDLTGKVNHEEWQGWGAEEVLFLGATGQGKDDDMWSVTFRFAVNETIPAGDDRLDFGGNLVLPEKVGWDYIWCQYEDAVVDDLHIQRPKAVYCEKVYPSADFADLGIGV